MDVVVRQNDSFLSQRGNVGGVRGSRATKDPSVSITEVCAGQWMQMGGGGGGGGGGVRLRTRAAGNKDRRGSP
eukprot:SAG31_NODE_46_length_30980_cov_226.095107_26_plen_72_part_01